MTILFCGDPHGSFSQIIRSVTTKAPSAVVIVGDHDLEQPLEQVLAAVMVVNEFLALIDCIEKLVSIHSSSAFTRSTSNTVRSY